jgi:chemotaxis protein CheX
MNTPIIVVSGYPEKVRDECIKMPQVTFYAKPVDLNVLLKDVETHMIQSQVQKGVVADVRVINAVIDATISVLQNFGGCKNIKNLSPRLFTAKEKVPQVSISGTIFVSSVKFRGEIIVSFDEAVFIKIISHILGETQLKITSDNNDAAGEIASIIFGQAKQKLSDLQIAVSEARFRVVQLPYLETIKDLGSSTLLIPFESNFGPFYVTVCVQAVPTQMLAAS